MRKIAAITTVLLGVFAVTLLLIDTPLPGAGSLHARALSPWSNGQAAQYVLGQPDFTSSGQGTSATTMRTPSDVAIDLVHNKLYVVDTYNHRVLRFSYPVSGDQPAAELVFGQANFTSSTPGTSQNSFSYPVGVTVDASGRLWVCDRSNNRVVWFDAAHTIASNQANASGVLGQGDYITGTSATTQVGMNQPYDLALTADGTLFVADAGNNRVLRFDQAASKTNGAAADGVLGQPSFIANSSATSQSGMYAPRGVAVYDQTLFVAERDNARVLRFDQAASKANGAAADGVLGQPNFASAVRVVTQSGLTYPGRLAVDGAGRLYVSDTYTGNRVLIFSGAAGKPNGAPADFVLGQPDFTSSGPATAQDRLAFSQSGGGLAIDTTNGLLLVADDDNNRALVFAAQSPLLSPQFEISKSGPASALFGSPITYTLTVTNTGSLTATNVTISDTLPSAAVYLGGGTPEQDGVVRWTLGSLGIGATEQVELSVTATETITNSVYSVNSAEGAASQGVQAVVTEFRPLPELLISKSGPEFVLVGDPITYTLTVDNSGLGVATDLVITDTLPVGATYLSGGTLLPDDVVRWTLPSLGPGQSTQVQFSVSANQTVTNHDYGVTSAEGFTYEGANSVMTVVYQLPALSISKAGPEVARVGGEIEYTLTVTNSGLGDATGLVITDTLPVGATYLRGGELLPGDIVRWTIPVLGGGETMLLHFSVSATETVTNNQYGVSCAEGLSAQGTVAVTTEPRLGLFLPLTKRAVLPER